MHSLHGSSGSQPCWQPGQTLLAQLLSNTAADTPLGWFVMQVWKQASVWQASQQSSSGTQSASPEHAHHSPGQAVAAQLVQLSPAPGQNGPPELELAAKPELHEPVELLPLDDEALAPPPLEEELAVHPPPLDDDVAVEPPPLDDEPTPLDPLEPLPLAPAPLEPLPLAPVPLDGPAPMPTEMPVAPPSPAPPSPSSKRISLPQAALSEAASAISREPCSRGASMAP